MFQSPSAAPLAIKSSVLFLSHKYLLCKHPGIQHIPLGYHFLEAQNCECKLQHGVYVIREVLVTSINE